MLELGLLSELKVLSEPIRSTPSRPVKPQPCNAGGYPQTNNGLTALSAGLNPELRTVQCRTQKLCGRFAFPLQPDRGCSNDVTISPIVAVHVTIHP